MWTRLIAGVTAHEINNFVHGLLSLLALAENPDATPGMLPRYASQAEERLRALEALARELRVLARSGEAGGARAHALDLACFDALTEIDPTEGRSVEVAQLPADARVGGSPDALRTAIRSLLRYGLAASPPGATVRLAARLDPGTVVVTVDAPQAPSPALAEMAPLIGASAALEMRADFGVVLAGALAAELGGELRVGPGAAGGVGFLLGIPRATAG